MNWKDNIQRVCTRCRVPAPTTGISLGWHGFSVTNAAGNKGHVATCPDCSPEVLAMLGLKPATQTTVEHADGGVSTQVLGSVPNIQNVHGGDCPDCDAQLRAKTMGEGGGVECSAGCGYWFCY